MNELDRVTNIISERKNCRKRLFTSMFTGFLIVTGGLIGLGVGALLFTYLVPFWERVVIDTRNHMFREIVFVDYYFFTNDAPSQDRVVLRTEDGELYSFHRNEWQLIPPPPIGIGSIEFFAGAEHALLIASDQGDVLLLQEDGWYVQSDTYHYRRDYPPCNKWLSPPPVFWRMADSYGTEFARPISLTSRCYVLLTDGTLHLWLRHINVFHMALMGWASAIAGMITGATIGIHVTRKRLYSRVH